MARAWMRRSKEDKGGFADLAESEFPDAPVAVAISHSGLNYKDGLSLTGRSPIMRRFPMIAGSDLVGRVTADATGRFAAGTLVTVNGFGLGETAWGGYSEFARVSADWPTVVPAVFDAAEAAGIGTAGYTAALAVDALVAQGVAPADGPVLVTGASGGVGGHALALLAAAGYTPIAVTGRPGEADYLKGLGAAEVMDRKELEGEPRPLGKERFRAAIDAVGGNVLANILSQATYGGVVAACGLAASMSLPTTVAPFILRGVSLIGVDSVMASQARRASAWKRLAADLDRKRLAAIMVSHRFDEVERLAPAILDQKIRGRVVLHW
jgi:acrylyl-CoA reductase (NADPH)